MATTDLSSHDTIGIPEKSVLAEQKYAIALSDWNSEVTHALLAGAKEALCQYGVKDENLKIVHVPGAFELSYAAKKLCQNKAYAAVITIGCVIQGGTPHFDYICEGVTAGITKLNIEAEMPVIFGVLTTNNLQEALDRSGGIHGNKGVEAAITAIKMANIIW